jgi:uncharacterized protein (TIGR00106 family)
MLFTVTMFPVGAGASIRKPVAEVVDEIDRAGLPYELSAGDTVIEAPWEVVMPVIQRAERRMRERHGRVFMLLTLDDRVGPTNRLHDAVEAVEDELHRPVPH